MAWNDEKTGRLVRGILDGKTSTELANELGMSRNAIAAKAKRMGLPLSGMERVAATLAKSGMDVNMMTKVSRIAKEADMPLDKFIAKLVVAGLNSVDTVDVKCYVMCKGEHT